MGVIAPPSQAPIGEGAVIAAEAVTKRFPSRRGGGAIHAVNGVSIAIGRGEVVGLVGESGCGKSTLSRMLIGIDRPTSGEVLLDGRAAVGADDWRALRRRVQYVFQDPFGSLCPTMTIGETLMDPMAIHGLGSKASRRERAAALLDQVGLSRSDLDRYPTQFSGGQRQRIGLARALALEPEIVICDEIVSGLDVSVQAQVLNLLIELQQRHRLGLLFISHDLRVVRYLCDRVVVMYLGQVVEEGAVADVFAHPAHPYTRGLLASIPDHAAGAPELRARVAGEPPSLTEVPDACAFAPRCPRATDVCRTVEPPVVELEGQRSRCHFAAAVAASDAREWT
jgi:oligopeptide/dipeptide ABC transporter ATP-binding protein